MRHLSHILVSLSLCSFVACGDDETSTTAADTSGSGSTTATSTTTTTTTAGTTTTTTTTMGTTTMGTTTDGSTGGSTGNMNTGFSFFATSVGSGAAGGNLGGLAGADAMCQGLADAAGSTRTWRAYLSTSMEDARDRIGTGPWFNTNMDMVAADVAALHADGLSTGAPQHVLDENGAEVPGPEHDILTGSQDDGTVHGSGNTCQDWTSNDNNDAGRVGHSDGGSWNNAHNSQGCDEQSLINSAGSGRLYCFAID